MVLDDGAIEALNMTFVEEFDGWKVDGLVSGT